jgi:hypothetical protein
MPGALTLSVLPESVARCKASDVEGLGLLQSGYGAGFILMKFWSFYNVHQAECDLFAPAFSGRRARMSTGGHC